MLVRAAIIALVLASSSWVVFASRPQASRTVDLSRVPMRLADWQGRHDRPFDDETLRVLGVDGYTSRVYESAAAVAPVSLYIGYYASQAQGDSMHSPLNCLPGAGWQPVSRARVRLGDGRTGFEANRLLVQKGIEQQLVLYWYEGRGRRVASEYLNKLWLMVDAVRLNRTDGSLVRLMVPVERGARLERASASALSFAAVLQPHLEAVLSERAEDVR